MPLAIIKNEFGGVDEQATIEAYYALHGRAMAEDLSRIAGRTSGDWTKTALRDGYSAAAVRDFQILLTHC